MGLLDSLMDDPGTSAALGLLSAGGYSRTPVSLGQGLAQAGQAYQTAQDRNEQRKRLAMQEQMLQMQLEDARQRQQDATALRNFDFGKFYLTPQQQAMAANGGPTTAAAGAVGDYAPKFDQKAMLGAMMSSDSPALKQQALATLTKESQPLKLGKDEQLIDPTTYKPLASNLVQEVKNGYLVSDGKGGWKIDPELYKAEVALKNAGATQVKMNPIYQVGNTFGEGVAKAGADRLMAQVEAASAMPQTVEAANQILTALDTGKVIAGPGTKYSVAVKQMFGGDQEKLKATRSAIQGMAKLALQSRQSLKGQGPITDYEQKMLSDAASGSIDNLTVDEIRLIANGSLKNAQYTYGLGKKASQVLSGMPEFSHIAPAFTLPELPSAYAGAYPQGAVREVSR